MARSLFDLADGPGGPQGMKAIARTARALGAYALFQASSLAARDEGLWLFGNQGDAFDGNSKYLFLWCAKNRPDITPVWITSCAKQKAELEAQGYQAVLRDTAAGVAARLRAGVYVYNAYADDVGATFANGAFRVNLWHGSGLKGVGATNKGSALGKNTGRKVGLMDRARRLPKTLAADMIVTTSPDLARKFADSYGLPMEHLPIIGTPRLDGALDAELKASVLAFQDNEIWRRNREQFSEVLVYMPTFREGHLHSSDKRTDFLNEAIPDLQRLSDSLARRNAVLYVKQHPWAVTKLDFQTNNIKAWPAGLDVYSVLDEVDGLITDYSSVMFDYLRVKQTGLTLYVFDLEKYLSERDLYFPFDESVAGVRAKSFDALCGAIETGAAVGPVDRVEAERVLKRCWEGSVHPASAQVVDEVKRRLSAARAPVAEAA